MINPVSLVKVASCSIYVDTFQDIMYYQWSLNLTITLTSTFELLTYILRNSFIMVVMVVIDGYIYIQPLSFSQGRFS